MKKCLLFFSILMLSFLILVGCGKKMFTVTFESNGGSQISAKEIEKGLSFDYEIPEKVGYTFEGWYTEETTNDSSKFTTNTIVLEDITLYAKWKINKYTIRFNTNDGTSVQDIVEDYNTPVTKPSDPTKIGYIFGGWYTDDALKTAYTFTTMPAQNINLFAKWNENSYMINFNSNGGSRVYSLAQDFNSVVTAPANPTKLGYTFAGWFSDEELLSPYTFTTMPAENITLHANWNANEYTISFEVNGGTAVEVITQDFDTTVTKPIDPTKVGFTFSGWYFDSAFTKTYTFTKMSAEDITVYAKWSINPYTISFNSNGGSNVTSVIGDFDTTITKPVDPTKVGYTFDGWYANEGLTNLYSFVKMPAENITLYAKWNINTYTISFISNEGSSVAAITKDYNTLISKPNDPERTGYKFGGWYTNEDLTTSYTFSKMPAENITLYAKWNINPYTISFVSNGGSSIEDIVEDYNTLIVEPQDLTKIGYTFSGWYSDADLTKPYTFTTMPAENITLYAKWDINSYKISFISNGGNSIEDIVEDYNTLITKPLDPIKVGHTFSGWYSDVDLTTSYSFNTMSAENITLYAKWQVDKYTISYGIVNDNIVNSDVLIPLEEGETIIDIANGSNHAGALTSFGRLFMWGENQFGQLGDGADVYNEIIPVEITNKFNLETDEKIAKIFIGYSTSTALTTKGRLFTWGSNYSAQLGDGTDKNFSKLPIEITQNFNLIAGEEIIQVDIGGNHLAAVTSDGRIFVWGSSYYGELGTDITKRTNLPIDITAEFNLNSDDKIIQVDLGEYHSAALTAFGHLLMWGRNEEGQLGDNTVIDKTFPIDITDKFAFDINETIVDINLGYYNTFVFTSKNRIFAWGENSDGQIGDNTKINRLLPEDITNIFELSEYEDLTGVESSGDLSFAFTSEGRIFAWGYNYYGQLGDGTTIRRLLPIDITTNFYLNVQEYVKQLDFGSSFTSLITTDGRIFTWGFNYRGQLGDGTTIDRWLPTAPKYEVIHSETYDYAASINPYTLEKTGYTFAGWYTDITCLSLSDITTMPAGNTILYGKWLVNEYTISFESNEGSSVDVITQDYNTIVTKPIDPVKTGFTFAGWYSDVELTEEYNFTTMPAENLTLYAKWNVNQYTITFDSNGGTNIEPMTLDFNETILRPFALLKIGYTFDGWYVDPKLTTIFSNIYMPAEDITVYAKWIANKYTIMFSSNDGSQVDDIVQDYNTVVSQPTDPTRIGHTFAGWYSDVMLTIEYEFSTMPAENIILYAAWKLNMYTINFDVNGGSPIDSITDCYNFVISKPTDPIKTGNSFVGWFIDKDLTASFEFTTMPAENIELYAKWAVNKYNLNYIYMTDDFIPIIGFGERIIKSDLNFGNSAVITSANQVFAWGDNTEGQLGDGTTIPKYLPINITKEFNLNVGETITQISISSGHSAAITSNGRVFTWGRNNAGQLGDGSNISKLHPMEITDKFGLITGETIIAIDVDLNSSVALSSNGRIFTWGSNLDAILGNGTHENKILPNEITDKFNLHIGETIIKISMSGFHMAALSSEGRMFTWGYNYDGALGDGTNATSELPIDITPKFNLNASEYITNISLSIQNSAAITSSGRIFTWGNNSYGQLGDGTTENKNIPTDISNKFSLDVGENIIQISLGQSHSFVLTTFGRTFAWGDNRYGQLGIGMSESQLLPIDITDYYNLLDGEVILFISSGNYHTSAITNTGRIFIWGENYKGQLGDGTKNRRYYVGETEFYLPLDMSTIIYDYNQTISSYIPIREGYTFINWYTDILLTNPFINTNMPTNDLYVYAKWNINDYTINFDTNGGSSVESITQDYNTEVTNPVDPTKAGYTFAGWYSDVELTEEYTFTTMPSANITIYAKWSLNTYSIDYITFENENDFVANLNFGETIVDLSLGEYHSFALTSEGRILAWGYNELNQLGDGTNISKSTPVDISSALSLSDNEYFIQVATRYTHSAALTSTGRVFTWGYNGYGELGNGSLVPATIPTDITNNFNLDEEEKISKIFIGANYSAALTSNNRLFTWGLNDYGQLGNGSFMPKSLPMDITNNFTLNTGENIVKVAISDAHGIALTSESRVFTWGLNYYGQLGDTTNIDKLLPVDITNNFYLDLDNTIVDIFASFINSAALSSNGHLYIWGSNYYGQLGNGGINDEDIPIDITDKFNLSIGETISKVSMSNLQASMLTSNGRLFTWGLNNYCELIDGTGSGFSNVPLEMTNNFRINDYEIIENVVLGGYHSSALTSEGNLFTWGYNLVGQLGDGSIIDSELPKQVKFQTEKLVNSIMVDYNGEITSYIPIKFGYSFVGWFSDFSCTIPFTLNNMPAYDLVLYGKWEANSYTISFEANGGTNVDPITQDYDTVITKPTNPIKEFYTFVGWYSDIELTKPFIFTTMPAQNITLYAKWVDTLYSISFDSNGGSNVDPIIQTRSTVVTKPEDPIKTGNTFIDWYQDAALTIPYVFSSMPAENITIYAKWEVNSYTISFEANGGTSVAPIIQNYGTLTMKPIDPTKEFYTFVGWYRDIELTNPYTFTIMPAENIMLYAKWIETLFTISFETNGGSSVETITQIKATVVTKPTDPTKTGYTFVDWYQDAALTTPYIFSSMPSENITVYAKWQINHYAISFESNGGTKVATIVQDYNTTVTKPMNPIKESYVFGYWCSDYGLTEEYVFSTMPAKNIVLYAKWLPTISFEVNGGTYVMPITQAYNTVVKKPITPLKTGHTFIDWYQDVDLTVPYVFSYMPVENITLYALWEINDYNLTYAIQTQVGIDEAIVQMTMGKYHSAALTSSGRVFTWGNNAYGQLGQGTTTNNPYPTDITAKFNLSAGDYIISISLGEEHSSAITSSGRIFTWGRNNYGQLGVGSTDTMWIPIDITYKFNLGFGEKIVYVALGNYTSAAITSNNRIFTWGNNQVAQLGDGTGTNRSLPVNITDKFGLNSGETIVQISLGSSHSAALSSTGRIFTWGLNIYGELGNGYPGIQPIPTYIMIPLMDDMITQISLGENHSAALTAKGFLFVWGYNLYGQLGDGTKVDKSVPEYITNFFPLFPGEIIVGVDLGWTHSIAITSNNRVFTWGANYSGQLGDGTTIEKLIPTEITNKFPLLPGEIINQVSLGESSSLVTSTGHVFTWGSNNGGILGNGTFDIKYIPTEIQFYYSVIDTVVVYEYNQPTTAYIPIKPGYTFVGWFTDLQCATPYTFSNMPAKNVVIYGKFTAI